MKLAILEVRIGLVVLVVALAIFLIPTFALDANWYVSPEGDDANDGSELNPWRSIQYAVYKATAGDTIKVMDDDDEATDDYVENIDVYKSLTIERYNDNGANPQVKTSRVGESVFYVAADNVIIDGLDIYGSNGFGVSLNEVSNCIIKNSRCGWDVDHKNSYGIGLSSSSNNTLSDNVCSSNDSSGIRLSSSSNNTLSDNICSSNNSYGIGLSSSSNNTLSGNTCSSNNSSDIWVYSGIGLSSSSNNTLSGNTCSSNNSSGIILLYSSSNNTLSDNVCSSNNSSGILLDSSSNNTLSGNTCQNNISGIGLSSSSNNTLSDNICSSNNFYSIALVYSSSNNTLSGNTCSSNNTSGIELNSSSNNTLSGNTCSSNNFYGIRLYSSSNNNTLSGNTCSSNNSSGILLYSSSDNTIYLNNFSSNTTNVSFYDSTNIWHSITKLGYLYGNSTQTYKSYMGNYYDDYSGIDGNNNGIGDSSYDLPGDEPDEYPLALPPDSYNLQTWWLANPTMYCGDMSKPGATVTLPLGDAQSWASDQPTLMDITFGGGDQAQETTWTGQITFTEAPAVGVNYTLEIGYADDQNGTNFWHGGPEAYINGDGSTTVFTFITNAVSFTIDNGKYLTLLINNDLGSTDYDVRVGGSWSYCSAPQGSYGDDYKYGDVNGDGSITAHDASLVLKAVVGLIAIGDPNYPHLTLEIADVTNDGNVTAYDAVLILQRSVGLIILFPVENKTAAPALAIQSERDNLMEVITQLENATLNEKQKEVLEQLRKLAFKTQLPKQTTLLQNYPNPFNPDTWIPFKLAQDISVTINIYDTKGQLIRTLHLGNQRAGIYLAKEKAAYWDGRNQTGEEVACGVYFYTLQAGQFKATRRMLIVK